VHKRHANGLKKKSQDKILTFTKFYVSRVVNQRFIDTMHSHLYLAFAFSVTCDSLISSVIYLAYERQTLNDSTKWETAAFSMRRGYEGQSLVPWPNLPPHVLQRRSLSTRDNEIND